MSTTEIVKGLLNEHQFTKAFVLDDAYDKMPEFSQLVDLVGGDLGDLLEKLDPDLTGELNAVLEPLGVEEGDWETAVTLEQFLGALW
ncbi:hypothetical protein EON81_26665, partial [bacterium]